MAPGTIRNLIWKKELQENIHYIRPTPRKILFIWNRVEAWLYGKPAMSDNDPKTADQKDCLINI